MGNSLIQELEPFDLKTTEIAGAAVHYEACFEEKLPAFEKIYREHLQAIESESFDRLADKQEAILEDLNRIVGGDEDLRRLQEQNLSRYRQMMADFSSGGRTFYLMDQKTIKDYLRGGGRLPNFRYDPATDTAEYLARMESTSDGEPQDLELTFPLSSAEQFEPEVRQIFRVFQNLRRTFAYPIAIHELAEISLHERLRSRAPHIRWFLDGMANVITAELLRKHFSAEEAEQWLADYTIEPYKDIEKMILLGYWMQMKYWNSSRIPISTEQELNHARYCYSVYEAKRLCDAHGIECIGKILAAFQGTEGRSEEDLLAAIEQATGEDMRTRLGQYQLFAGRVEGRELYRRRFEQVKQDNDAAGMLTVLLRMLELADNPLSEDSLRIRKEIARLLAVLGHPETAEQIMQETGELKAENKGD